MAKVKELTIAIDFDGTIVEHEFPAIGPEVPGAFAWMATLQSRGAKLILWTMRSANQAGGDPLQEAVDFCRSKGITFHGINSNPEQHWSSSPKAYAHVYVDDAAFGCPLLENPRGRPFVDWSAVGPALLQMLESREAA